MMVDTGLLDMFFCKRSVSIFTFEQTTNSYGLKNIEKEKHNVIGKKHNETYTNVLPVHKVG